MERIKSIRRSFQKYRRKPVISSNESFLQGESVQRPVFFLILIVLFTCAAQGGVVLSASPSPATFGAPVTLTATVTPSSATGKVTFFDGMSVLGTSKLTGGTATLTVPLNSTGARSLTARYVGDASNPASVSSAVTELINSIPAFGFTPHDINLNRGIQDFAVADFNGDGKADVAVVGNGNQISVYLGNGDGTFGAAVNTTPGISGNFMAIAAADFDGDGIIDVAIGNSQSNNVQIMLGKGDGTFITGSALQTAAGTITVGDLNLDGIPDLAIPHIRSSSIGVLLGKGDGTFGNAVEYPVLGPGGPVLIADLDGDGKPDLMTVISDEAIDSSVAVVRLGVGDGTFGAPKSSNVYLTGEIAPGEQAYALADVNGDGKLDLVLAPGMSGAYFILVCLGKGDGTFAPSTSYTAPGTEEGIGEGLAVIDVDGDGILDTIADFRLTAGGFQSNDLETYYGNGDGSFQKPAITQQSKEYVEWRIVPVDLNGDGRVDFVSYGIMGVTTVLKTFIGSYGPHLRIATSHSETLTQGQNGATFTIVVSNEAGAATTSGIVAAQFQPSSYLSGVSLSGTGWSCFPTQCTRSDPLAGGASYPTITATANISSTSPSPLGNNALVSGGNSETNSAEDLFTVNPLAAGCSFAVIPAQVNFDENVDLSSVTLATGSACGWLFSSDSSWLTVDSTSGTGPSTVGFRVAPNSGPQRIGILTMAGISITVTQGEARTPTAVFRDPYGAIGLSSYASLTLSNSGGSFASDPSEAQDFLGNTFVTARDNFNAIWANIYNPLTAAWSGWTFGGGVIQGVPAIAVDLTDTAWIASRDAYNSYWLAPYNASTGFGTWTALHGVFSTDPVVTTCPDGSVYVIGKDNYNALWSGQFIPGLGFQGWYLGGGVLNGQPAATCGVDSHVYIVARDTYNSLWMGNTYQNSWGTWWNGGGVSSIDPQVADFGESTAAVVILDPTGAVWTTTVSEEAGGNGWNPWVRVGGILQDVAASVAQGQLFLVGRSPSGDLWWWQQTGSQWSSIGNNGVAAGNLSAGPK
jgi:hypothetical protein